ncbi:hypothetical protein J1605_018386 [Eschrichtius robustus]|uniref:Defective in cullin neddylation protein 1-like protein n=1 Tax=Eschrichtius robustus TaxID=9764 RepID=A0AB34HR94_ESCRO|nr:hypothetical protein J1605_018386 [Eschrichtius robustus]
MELVWIGARALAVIRTAQVTLMCSGWINAQALPVCLGFGLGWGAEDSKAAADPLGPCPGRGAQATPLAAQVKRKVNDTEFSPFSFKDFQLNSHLSTLANIHKIYHTLNKLNLTEDVGQDDHQTGRIPGAMRAWESSFGATELSSPSFPSPRISTLPGLWPWSPASQSLLLRLRGGGSEWVSTWHPLLLCSSLCFVGSLRSCSSSDCFSKVMPPRKKRRPASGDDLSAKKSRHDRFNFYKLHFITGTDDVVGPEGMEKFCEDIGVEPENVSLTY